jgi:hypothetical protein
MVVNYKPIVDVRVFSDSEKGKGKEVAEVAKYTVKSSNIMANLKEVHDISQDIKTMIKIYTESITDEIVKTLDSALHGRNLLPKGGIFKEMHRKLNLNKNSEDDLIYTGVDDDEDYTPLNYDIEKYRWDIKLKNYVRVANVIAAVDVDSEEENNNEESEVE